MVQLSSGMRSQPAGQANVVRVRSLGSIAVEIVAVQLDQRLDVLGPVAAPPAVGGDAEVVDEPLGGDDAGLGADETVGGVDEAEVQARLRSQGELGQGLEEADVDAPALHRQVDPVERPAEAERQGVGDVDERLGVVGPLTVVALVPVAEVVAELDVGRECCGRGGRAARRCSTEGRRTTSA